MNCSNIMKSGVDFSIFHLPANLHLVFKYYHIIVIGSIVLHSNNPHHKKIKKEGSKEHKEYVYLFMHPL